jgi:hypothetical protein
VTGGTTAFSSTVLTARLLVNTAPVLAAGSPTLATIIEDAKAPPGNKISLFADAFISDPDVNAKKGIAVTATTGNGTWQYTINGGTTWKSVGTVSLSSALLLSDNDMVRFLPAANSDNGASITYHAWDQTTGTHASSASLKAGTGGGTSFSSGTQTASLTVSPVNDAPVLAGTASALTPEITGSSNPAGQSASALLSGLVTDPDPGALQGIAVTGDSGSGNWQFTSNGGKNWTSFGNVSSSSALLLPNTYQVRFLPNNNFNSAATLTYRAWDQTIGSAGTTVSITSTGGSTAFSTSSLTANLLVNTAPVLAAANPTLINVLEDNPNPAGTVISSFADVFISDADKGPLKGIAVTGTKGSGTWQFSINGGLSWTKFPKVSTSSALLLKDSYQVRFVPAANFNGTVTLTYAAWDQTTGTGGKTADLTLGTGGGTSFSTGTQKASLTVVPVNDAPILSGPAPVLTPVTPGNTNPPGQRVSDLLTGRVTDADGAGAFQGIAVTATTGGGTWQYSVTGTSWTSFGTVSPTSALLLPSSYFLRFVPNSGFLGTATLSYRAWDQTSGGAGTKVNPSPTGRSTAFSTASLTASLLVNTAPVLA